MQEQKKPSEMADSRQGEGGGREQQQFLIRDMEGKMDKEMMKKIQGEGAKKKP